MSERERNLATVRRFYDEVVNAGNFEVVDECFADDFVNHDAGPGSRNDREGMKDMFRSLRGGFPDLHFDVQLMLADGPYVFNRGIATGNQTGPYRGGPPTGRPVRFQEMHVYEMRDGLIIGRWWVAELLKFQQQLAG